MNETVVWDASIQGNVEAFLFISMLSTLVGLLALIFFFFQDLICNQLELVLILI